MSSLTITRPIVPSRVRAFNGDWTGTVTPNPSLVNLATPDPKEVGIVPGNSNGNSFVDYDVSDFFGNQTVDSFFVGYHNALNPGQSVQFLNMDNWDNPTIISATPKIPMFNFASYAPLFTSFKLTSPWSTNFIRASFISSTPVSIGLFGFGLAFQPVNGHEWGAGRPVVDTGRASRLPSGGFGIEEGAIVGGYQWTLGDVQPGELPKLYDLLRSRGTTKPVWVIEDPDLTAGLNERTHYGLFTKIETYERLDPRNTRIGLQMEDWA